MKGESCGATPQGVRWPVCSRPKGHPVRGILPHPDMGFLECHTSADYFWIDIGPAMLKPVRRSYHQGF